MTAVARAWRKDLAVIVAAAFYVLVVCFYAVGNPVRIFSWYTIAPAMCFTIVAVYGIEEWFTVQGTGLEPRARVGIAALVAVGCAASVIVALPSRVASVNGHVGDLRALGQRIARGYPAAKSLLIADIGVIGYTTDVRIIDLAGLVSPVSVAQENGQRSALLE